MYIEMVDETGQVSDEILKQTQEILEFAAQKIGKEDKEMAVTFVTNERSHELNLEYRDTDRPTDVISLEYKPEMEISFDEEDLAENPELAEMMAEFDTYIGELFISIDKAREQAEDFTSSLEFAITGIFTAIKEERNMRKHALSALVAILAGLVFRISATEWLFLLLSITLVIAFEIMNSAIENVVDLASNYHFSMLAKNAKDMAAGAVLVVSVFALVTGLIIFVPKFWALVFG